MRSASRRRTWRADLSVLTRGAPRPRTRTGSSRTRLGAPRCPASALVACGRPAARPACRVPAARRRPRLRCPPLRLPRPSAGWGHGGDLGGHQRQHRSPRSAGAVRRGHEREGRGQCPREDAEGRVGSRRGGRSGVARAGALAGVGGEIGGPRALGISHSPRSRGTSRGVSPGPDAVRRRAARRSKCLAPALLVSRSPQIAPSRPRPPRRDPPPAQNGKTALDYARQGGETDCIRLLE